MIYVHECIKILSLSVQMYKESVQIEHSADILSSIPFEQNNLNFTKKLVFDFRKESMNVNWIGLVLNIAFLDFV